MPDNRLGLRTIVRRPSDPAARPILDAFTELYATYQAAAADFGETAALDALMTLLLVNLPAHVGDAAARKVFADAVEAMPRFAAVAAGSGAGR